MKRRSASQLIPVIVVLLLVAAGIWTYRLAQNEAPAGQAGSATAPRPALDIPSLDLTPPPSLAELSAEVAADYPELAELLDNPELASVYKDFYITYQNGGQEAALAMAQQRGILNEAGDVVMTLILDTAGAAGPLTTELEAAGVVVEGSYQDRINIVIPMDLILEQLEAKTPEPVVEQISGLEHVISLQLPNRLVADSGNWPAPKKPGFWQKPGFSPRQNGSWMGEGVEVTLADRWHQQGITGAGVKVGILDLGFAGYEALLGQELPPEVMVATFGNTAQFATQVHGTACAEIVHEMAPDAEIYLAYFDGSEVALGQAVDWLLSQGVQIISNSTSISGLTPMDGSGFAAGLANRVREAGILWVNAAGNRASEHYRGRFQDSDGDTLHEFGPGLISLPFTAKAGAAYLILSWNDWGQVDQDYDLILFDKTGAFLAKAEDYQTGQPGQRPAEVISYRFDTADTYLLAVQNREGRARGDAVLDIFVYNGKVPPEFRVAEASLGTPADAQGAFAIGAVNWANDALEPYSSQGPTSDGRIKPDLVAPSAVKSASYRPFFDGTSAATPHVAGAAALILQSFPDFRPDDITTLLQNRAIKLGPAPANNQFGAGRLNLGQSPDLE
jgi:subtilisin family serine protease